MALAQWQRFPRSGRPPESMAVRFLPVPEERGIVQHEDRADLAEVIELRAKLPRNVHSANQVDTAASDPAVSDPAASDPAASGWAAADPDAADPVAVEAAVVEAAEAAAEADEAAERDCTEDAVRILARRARSSGELEDELRRLGHEPHVVAEVIDECERSHYLDDEGLARAVTEKLRTSKRASRAQIRRKLRERKLPDGVIELAVSEIDADEEAELLRHTAADRARRLGGLDRQTAERRLLGFLARRGWTGEPAIRAVRDALDQVDSVDDGNGRTRSTTRGGSGVRFTR